ncbi:MAG: AAA family ATPase [Actinomycetota bacterium]|nr:AAA family ATPase [Actinomycetota bacterium]
MEAISVALAMQSGEIASRTIAAVEGHPLLDCCGIARTVPDLIRLLERFHPLTLLISPFMLEDIESLEPAAGDALLLNSPLAFLLPSGELYWDKEDIHRTLLLPIRYCGLISHDLSRGEDLYDIIKRKVDLYNNSEMLPCPAAGRPGRDDGGSKLITVTGAKGGVGATLLSSVLAAVLASTDRRVLLMDLDSDLSQLLLLKPGEEGKTLCELLPMAEEVSWDLVRISTYRHPSGFYLLPHGDMSAERPGPGEELPESFLRNLLFLFDVILIDFPRPFRKSFLPLLRRSPLVLLTAIPNTLCVHCTRRTASFLRRTGLENDALRLVVNRCGPHHALRPEELATAAGTELIASFPDDERSGMDFSELGELPATGSPLMRAAVETVYSMGFDIGLPAKGGSTPWLGRIFNHRRSAVTKGGVDARSLYKAQGKG